MKHRRSRISSALAGQDVCRCGRLVEHCPVLNPPKPPPPPRRNEPEHWQSAAPLLTRGQRERVYPKFPECPDLR